MRFEKRCLTFMLVLLVVFFSGSFIEPSISYAHSGRTDSSGGHHDYQNKSGLGSYHYHCGGHPAHLHENGVCPYSSQGDISQSNSSASNSSAGSSGSADAVQEVTAKSLEIKLDESIEAGSTTQISPTITPENTENKSLTYSSSDDSIATVSADGVVTGISPGEAVISAVTSNGIRKEVKITISEVEPTEIECKDQLEMVVGEKQEIAITVLPESAANKEYTVTVDDPEILKCADNKITAVKEGSTDVHIETWNGIKKDIHVKVGIIPAEKIEITDSTEYVTGNTVDLDGTILLKAKVKPSNATYQKVQWKSSDPDVIEVKDGKFQIKGTGEVTLTCSTEENISESIDITVEDDSTSDAVGGVIVLCVGGGAIYAYRKRKKKSR